MGSGPSAEWNHEEALLKDMPNPPRSMEWKEEEKKGDEAAAAAKPANRSFPRRTQGSAGLSKTPFEKEGPMPSIWHAFLRGATKFPENKCLGTRPYKLDKDGKYTRLDKDGNPDPNPKTLPVRELYKYWTYKQVQEQATAFGAGLSKLGLVSQDSVSIYSINRPEWTVVNLGNFSQSYRTVALYDTLGADAASYIIGHADCKVVVCSKDKIKKVFAMCKDCPTVKVVVQFDTLEDYNNVEETLDAADVTAGEAQGLQVFSYTQMIKMGKDSGLFPNPAGADDLAFIMYTSGTTGPPKGAMLSHGNCLACCSGALNMLTLDDKTTHLSYLPLAHIFESVVQIAVLCCGGGIASFQGDPKKLPDDFKDSQVTLLCGVPRVFERFYDRVQAGIQEKSCLARSIAEKAFRVQTDNIRRGLPRDEWYDNKVMIPVRERMGLQNVTTIVTGAAPMAAYLSDFLRVLIGCPVLQGYGMTESAAAMSISQPDDVRVGHVGPPITCSEICLEDVEDMGYKHTDKNPRGEILVRGPNVFKGYFKNPEETAKALEADGWLHTGDVGRWNPNGTLSIIDRKKNMLKLSQGEYIALEKVEGCYKNLMTAQVWVYGNSYHSFVVAVVVPDTANCLAWLQGKGWWPSGMEYSLSEQFRAELKKQVEAHLADYKTEVMTAIGNAATANKLSSLEKVKGIHVETEWDANGMGFNVENDCITPTFKLKRNMLAKRYVKQLQDLYTAGGEAPKDGEVW